MPTSIIITLPRDADELRDEIEERLGVEANVYQVPPTYTVDLEQIKLIVEIAAGAAALIKTLLDIKQRYADEDTPTNVTIEKPGKGSVVLDEADEATLRDMVQQQPSK
jgi:hypothetical protein